MATFTVENIFKLFKSKFLIKNEKYFITIKSNLVLYVNDLKYLIILLIDFHVKSYQLSNIQKVCNAACRNIF